jgi:hypothetical protein
MRVIREGGYALTPPVVIVRNLLRVVDFLPGGYFLGLLVMMLNRRYKRIGDFVAGTIVIRDRPRAAAPGRVATRLIRAEGSEEVVAEMRRAGVHRLPPERLHLVEDFLSRRHTLSHDARRRIADQLARSIAEELGVQPGKSEPFLQAVLVAHRQNEDQAAGEAPTGGPP